MFVSNASDNINVMRIRRAPQNHPVLKIATSVCLDGGDGGGEDMDGGPPLPPSMLQLAVHAVDALGITELRCNGHGHVIQEEKVGLVW